MAKTYSLHTKFHYSNWSTRLDCGALYKRQTTINNVTWWLGMAEDSTHYKWGPWMLSAYLFYHSKNHFFMASQNGYTPKPFIITFLTLHLTFPALLVYGKVNIIKFQTLACTVNKLLNLHQLFTHVEELKYFKNKFVEH